MTPQSTARRASATISGSALLALALMSRTAQAAASDAIGLATAAQYSVLAGSTASNTGPSVLAAGLGVSPGTALTGFDTATVSGATHAGDSAAAAAAQDLGTAYDRAAGLASTTTVSGDLGGHTFGPGVLTSTSGLALTGPVTLDAAGDPDAVFVFQIASTLVTASASSVVLTGGAQACHVYWQIGSSATLGTSSGFAGTIMAEASISVGTGARIDGRALARTGAVTLDSDTFSDPGCATPPPGSDPAPVSADPTAGPSSPPAGGTTATTSGTAAPTTSPNPDSTTAPSTSSAAAGGAQGPVQAPVGVLDISVTASTSGTSAPVAATALEAAPAASVLGSLTGSTGAGGPVVASDSANGTGAAAATSLPFTGSGPVPAELGVGLALIASGSVFAFAGRRRLR